MAKILFLDDNHPVLTDKLKNFGFEIHKDFHSSKNDIISKIGEYDGIVIRSRIPIDSNLLDAAKKLKFIARVGAGMENIDIEYAKKKGIELFNAPEGNRDAVAEHALGMLLMLFNKLKIIDTEVRKGIWLREENRGVELKGKVVGILGYGFMGKAFAERLAGFGVKTICYDILPGVGDQWASQVTLEEFFKQTDILSIHLPLTPHTKHMVDKSFIESFSKPIYIINTARGECLPLADLHMAIKNEKVKGACLDVLEIEKSSFENLQLNERHNSELENLFQSDKILFSPHVAGWTVESKYKLANVIADKIIAYYSGGE